MMKMRSSLSFAINLAIFCAASLPILAQSTPTVQSLPNGDYFYGEVSDANQTGKDYIFLRKASNTATAFGYRRNTSDNYCFRGTINSNTIIDATFIDLSPDSPKHTFSQISSIDLSSFYILNDSDTQVNTKQRLTECIELFEENNKRQNPTKPR